MEVIVEGVGPEQHARASSGAWAARSKPYLEGTRGEGGHRAPLGDASRRLGERAEHRGVRCEIGETGRKRRQPRPPVDKAHRVGAAWAEPAGVVVGKEL